MGFDATAILRRYRGEWIRANVSDPYMAGETVRDLGSVYFSNVDGNAGNLNPGDDPNWTLSARTAEVGTALGRLIGTASSPTTYGSILSGLNGSPVTLPPSTVGANLVFTNGQLGFTSPDNIPSPREVFTHFGSSNFHISGDSPFADLDLRCAVMAISSNNKLYYITNYGYVYRCFTKDIVPRGAIDGVREAVWSDWNYWYVIDSSNNLHAQEKASGAVIMITDNVRSIATTLSLSSRVIILKMDGTVFGWGDNASSYLVPNETMNTGGLIPPTQISGLSNINRIYALESSPAFFAANADNELFSWGRNVNGLLGRNPVASGVTQGPVRILQNFHSFYSWFRLRSAAASTLGPLDSDDGLIVAVTLDDTVGGLVTWGSESLAIPHAYLGQGTTRTPDNWEPTQIATSTEGAYRHVYFRDEGDLTRLLVFVVTNNGSVFNWGIDDSRRAIRANLTAVTQFAYGAIDFSFYGAELSYPNRFTNDGITYLCASADDVDGMHFVKGSRIMTVFNDDYRVNNALSGSFVDARGFFILSSNGVITRLRDHDAPLFEAITAV